MSDKIRNLDDFLLSLKGVKPGKAGQYMALCPGHDDKNRSLTIKLADGKILVKCFAGCALGSILKPLDLEAKDLFLNDHKPKPEYRKIVAVYHYDGFEVVRTQPKGFYQRRPDGKGGYIYNVKNVELRLYHQDELPQAIDGGKAVYVVEGEKDVDRLRSEGLTATCNPMGAGKWRDNYSQALNGADVVIIPDNDTPGRDHAVDVVRTCYGKAARIRVFELPTGKDVSEWLDNGHTAAELTQLTSQCPDFAPPAATLPEIVVTDRHLRDITTDALGALYKANKPERLFRRSNVLTRIHIDEKGRPITESLNESALRGHLARSCNFVRIIKDEKGEERNKPVSPPLDVVRDIYSLGSYDFPPLIGITEVPVIRPDGTVVNTPGYDNYTNLYYCPSPDLVTPSISDIPNEDEIKSAICTITEPFCDFPFDGEASRANAIATMSLPILRPMIEGPVPLTIIDKPQAGTGASLLAEVVSLIATGRPAAMMTAQKDDESWRKAITSLLIKGQLVVTIDNVEYDLFAPSLAAMLTATSYQDRVLGRSEVVTLPNRTTWVATGNNIRLRGDLPRRCIWIRMDAKTARPWQRDPKGFKHPRLMEWVSTERGDILAAILIIIRAWVVAGMPEAQGLPHLGGYESYCRIIGGVLAYMGVSGFLANLDAMYNETDTETPQWEGFLETWHDVLKDKTLTGAELISHLNENAELRAALPDTIADTQARNYTHKLGNALSKRNCVRYPNGLMISKGAVKHHAVTWGVEDTSKGANSPQISLGGELGESKNALLHGEKQNFTDNIQYKGKVDTNSPNSRLNSEKGELAPGGLPDCPSFIGMTIYKALELWRQHDAPVIQLRPGEKCTDLEKLLSRPDVSPEQLQAIRDWLEKNKDGSR